jgi:hypothetical protein
MTIPSQWSTLPVERKQTTDSVTQPYCLKADEEVKFMLFYRGKEVSANVASDFQAILDAPPHKLSEDEYRNIIMIIRHMSEDDFFERYSVETREIDGRTVLAVEGMWTRSAVKNYGIFVPGNASGTIIDELHYYAPADKYVQYLPAGQEILQSIKFVHGDRRAP